MNKFGLFKLNIFVFFPTSCFTNIFCCTQRLKSSTISFKSCFYAWGEPVYIILMLISTAVIYAVGLLIDKFDNKQKIRTALFIISLVYNLGILIVFKYSTSFIENINSLFGANIYNPKLPLPIGLSFYTFQALSYVIDVYLRKVKVQKILLI